ncbi:hypothetical protein O3P16_16065 [Chitinophagaceae bacterium LY-5]|uniref:DUF2569 family protein n=1 Tax=Polluticaenibacter yanchengensis TaxID=3014562 RepID=A0ABT4UQA6_9BACT|nr:hypothetical protein [Chitinophagaceae bacterium LY-5]
MKGIKKYYILLIEFVLSIVVSLLLSSIWLDIVQENFHISEYFYILVLGFPSILPFAMVVYFLYFILICVIFRTKISNFKFISITILSIIYLIIVLYFTWKLVFSELSLADFIKVPNICIVYTLVSIPFVLISIFKNKSMLGIEAKNDVSV